ncbi:MAG: aminopeptidase N, partial [Gammaproteobacteria bacterium]|nr:aminopeptidase N [Gammaproteobacteria bacterium]
AKTEHAMNSLIASIQWDEARFNLALDLDRFMIVAVSDFNAGAMENKGLNIFNAAYILADPATATDVDYANIESVVAHEYFHNWTGNRVTCQDWFQLSLKEGLTVFRDQEFSQDLAGSSSAKSVLRIEDVRALRTIQFAEDAGPMAHPVRPDSVAEIDNFYTATIYEKGAEVIRMMQTIVGKEGFAKGLALYFARHDGQAVTCDDFLAAIADANPESLLSKERSIFSRWYSQAGTPKVQITSHFNFETMVYTLTLKQSNTVHQQKNLPFLIPIQWGLVGQGDDESTAKKCDMLVCLGTEHNTVEIKGLTNEPVPSLVRGFSAPVLLEYDYTKEQLLTLLQKDTDTFNRWEASQRLYIQAFHQQYPQALEALQAGTKIELEPLEYTVVQALQDILTHPDLDSAYKDLVLTLPSERYLSEVIPQANPKAIHVLREAMRRQLAVQLVTFWAQAYARCDTRSMPYHHGFPQRGLRSLANLSLSYLCSSGQGHWAEKTFQIYKNATNMTLRQGALMALLQASHPLAENALSLWHQWYKNNPLLLDKWFAFQALAPDQNGSTLRKVKNLITRPDFSLRNPNRARSVLFNFCLNNPNAFHNPDGYDFWYDHVISLDTINPPLAARFARAMEKWSTWPEPFCSQAKLVLNKFQSIPLSPVLKEIIFKSMGTAV